MPSLRKANLLFQLLVLVILWIPATAGRAFPNPVQPPQSLWIIPRNWLTQDPNIGFSPIITKATNWPYLAAGLYGKPDVLPPSEDAIVEFRKIMGGNTTIIQLNDIPVQGPVQFSNFDRTFSDTHEFEEFMVQHLKNNYATTILDLSHRGPSSQGDFEGYRRTRRMSKQYPDARFISFGPIALRVDSAYKMVPGKRKPRYRPKYLISTNYLDVRQWAPTPFSGFRSYTYNPVERLMEEGEDFCDILPIRIDDTSVEEYDSRFFARLTENGTEYLVSLDDAVQALWGEQFKRHGPIPWAKKKWKASQSTEIHFVFQRK